MITVKLKVDNSNIMSSIENASIKVTSPTGKTLRLKKKNLKNKNCTEEMVNVFWKCCQNTMIKFIGEVDVTLKEMELLLKFSNL